MGRYSTGAMTTEQVIRIELSYLIKKGYIKKDHHIKASLTWTNDSSIGFESYYIGDDPYIRLKYNITKNATGEVTSHDYKIHLATVPSNLGKGEVVYMICPVTGNRCRVLYKCYGSLTWKSREAYQHRIYYESQIEPKSVRPYKYLFCDRQFEELYKKAKKSHYRGKPTRLMKRIETLERKSDMALLHYVRFERLMAKIK